MKSSLKNKIAVITGSGSGVGKATALRLCESGAIVILNGRNEEKLQTTQKEFESYGYSVEYCVADVTNYHDCCWLTDFVIQKFGRIDIVIANGSISMSCRFEDTKPHLFKLVVDSTIYGVVMPLFSFLPHLKKSQGSFVLISSIAGLFGVPTASAYCTGKMALTALYQSLRAELYVYKIHFGIMYLGFTENDANKKTLAANGDWVPVPKRTKYIQFSQKRVANAILKMINARKNQNVLSSVGKLTYILSRFAPFLIHYVARISQKRLVSKQIT